MSTLSKKMDSADSQLCVSVLVACHNRKNTTIKCLKSLYAAKPKNWTLKIYLVDDGSTDGTGNAVHQFDPGIQIIKGNGSWYWAHSMYQAEMAISEPHDAIMWLNDDVVLDIDSLKRLDYFTSNNSKSILIGQFRSSTEEKITYGGYFKYDRHPFHFKQIYSEDNLMQADTFNGNLVFIPKLISDRVGPIDGGFAHAYADIDYGLRSKRLGIEMLVIPGFLGFCDENPQIKFKNLGEKLKSLLSIKSSPIKSQIRFLRRHGNFLWPVYLFAPILKVLLNSFIRKVNL